MKLIWFYALAFLLVIVFIIALIAAGRDTKKAGNRVIRYLLDIEDRYAYYIEQKTEQADSKHSLELNKHNIVNEAIIILKPDIEALIAHINATTYNKVKIEYYHGIFKSIAPISEQYFKQSRLHKDKNLSEADEEEFFAAFEDAIRSDLTSRLLAMEG